MITQPLRPFNPVCPTERTEPVVTVVMGVVSPVTHRLRSCERIVPPPEHDAATARLQCRLSTARRESASRLATRPPARSCASRQPFQAGAPIRFPRSFWLRHFDAVLGAGVVHFKAIP